MEKVTGNHTTTFPKKNQGNSQMIKKKKKTVVESHDRSCPERTLPIEEKEADI